MGRSVILLATLVTAVVLAGCGTDDSGVRDLRTQAAKAVSAGEASSDLSYTIDDTSITGPASASSGWVRFTATNQGQNVNHLAVLQLWEGKAVADLAAQAKPGTALPSWATPAGGPADMKAGESGNVTVLLDPGAYALGRFVKDANNVSWLASSPLVPLSIAAGASTGAEPVPSVHFNMTGVGYVTNPIGKATRMLTSPIKQGSHIIKVENTGTAFQEVRIIRLADGVAPDAEPLWEIGRPGGFTIEAKAKAAAAGATRLDLKLQPAIGEDGVGPTAPPVGEASGGMMPLWPGKTAYISMDFSQGVYVIYSSLPKPGTDQPYFLVAEEIDHFEVWR